MVGIVVVSHHPALARAALDLAGQMVPADRRTRVELAAGNHGRMGTDAVTIRDAITSADDGDGVLVLMDLGSSVLSSELAVDMLDPSLAARVCLSAAPLVEGFVAALVAASNGDDLAAVERVATAALDAKARHLDVPAVAPATTRNLRERAEETVFWRTIVHLAHGLHARPAAALVLTVGAFDVTATVVLPRTGAHAAAESVLEVQGLGARRGDEVVVELVGPGAPQALAALDHLAQRNFDEDPTAPQLIDVANPGCAQPLPPHELGLAVDVSGYTPGDVEDEMMRLEAAVLAADGFLADLVAIAEQESLVRDDRVTPAVLAAVRAILHDPVLQEGFGDLICQGHDAVAAVQETIAGNTERFEALDEAWLRGRAVDLRSIERVVLACLTGADPTLDQPSAGHAVVVDDLDALTAAQLDPEDCPILHVRNDAVHGHGPLVARARGITVVAAAAR